MNSETVVQTHRLKLACLQAVVGRGPGYTNFIIYCIDTDGGHVTHPSQTYQRPQKRKLVKDFDTCDQQAKATTKFFAARWPMSQAGPYMTTEIVRQFPYPLDSTFSVLIMSTDADNAFS